MERFSYSLVKTDEDLETGAPLAKKAGFSIGWSALFTFLAQFGAAVICGIVLIFLFIYRNIGTLLDSVMAGGAYDFADGIISNLSSVPFLFIVYLLTFLPSVLFSVWLVRRSEGKKGSALSALLPSEKISFSNFFGGVWIILLFSAVGNLASVLLNLILGFAKIPAPEFTLPVPTGVFDTVLLGITIVLLPPLFEEILFRGVCFNFTKDFGGKVCALVSGLTFSLIHANLSQIPAAFFFGFAAGYMVWYYKNIWIGVVAHFINNALAFSITLLPADSYGYSFASVSYLVISAVLGIAFLIRFLNRRGAAAPASSKMQKKALSAILLHPTYMVFAILSLLLAAFAFIGGVA